VGGGDRAEHRQHVDAAADLVHLVAVRLAQLRDAVAPRSRESRQLRAGRGIRRRMYATRHRVVPGDQRVRPRRSVAIVELIALPRTMAS
jgi:hypothetical protein